MVYMVIFDDDNMTVFRPLASDWDPTIGWQTGGSTTSDGGGELQTVRITILNNIISDFLLSGKYNIQTT